MKSIQDRSQLPDPKTMADLIGMHVTSKWRVGVQLPAWSLPNSFEIVDDQGSTNLLAKIEILPPSTNSALSREVRIYSALEGDVLMNGILRQKYEYDGKFVLSCPKTGEEANTRILQLLGFHEDKNVRALIFPKVGRSLAYLLHQLIYFSKSTVCKLANHTITALEEFHDEGYVHGNVCPEVFHVSPDHIENDIIHLTDLSNAKYLYNPKTQSHIEMSRTLKYDVNEVFSSPNCHRRLTLSRRDDMISLGYVLIICFQRELPWFCPPPFCKETQTTTQEMAKMKGGDSLKGLFYNLPVAFQRYFSHVNSLVFEERPDYEGLRSIFSAELHIPLREVNYDWTRFRF